MIEETIITVDLSDHATLMECYVGLNKSFRKQKERIAELEAETERLRDYIDTLEIAIRTGDANEAKRVAEKDARIAELEEARDKAISFVKKQTDDKIDLYDAQYYMRQRIAELEAENAKLRTALKPFADVAEEVNAINLCYRDIEIWVAVADLRAARAALEKKKND